MILGASFDDVAANARFAEKYKFPFSLLCDTERKIGLAYGATEDPSSGTAKRISYLIGADGKIVQAWPKVKPADHPAEVLALL